MASRNMPCLMGNSIPIKKMRFPMHAILSGLLALRFNKTICDKPLVIEASWTGKRQCPHCNCASLRTKDSFWRYIKYGRIYDKFSILKVRCHKFICLGCKRFFNTQIAGLKLWSRSTQALKRSVFTACNKGCTVSTLVSVRFLWNVFIIIFLKWRTESFFLAAQEFLVLMNTALQRKRDL